MYQVRDLHGSTIIVTGANSGTGKEATKRMAAAGAHVVLAVRSTEKGEQAAREIREAHPHASLEVRQLDLASLASVHEFCQPLLDDGWLVDVLVNNAGVMAPPQRLETADGFELQFGTNFLGPFALTNLLMPCLLRAPQPRVATMSSMAATFGHIHFDDLDWRRGYQPWPAYGQSKLADLLMGQRLAAVAEERGWNLVSTIAHPGYTRTNLQTAGAALGTPTLSSRLFQRFDVLPAMQPEQGAEPLLYASTDPSARNGHYYGPDGRLGMTGTVTEVSPPRTAQGPDLARSLWAVAEDITGCRLPA